MNMKNLFLIALVSLSLVTGVFVTSGFSNEIPYTKTYYNNNLPYELFVMGDHHPTNINVQVVDRLGRKVQAVIPTNIVNDEEKDLTQQEKEKGQK